MTNMEQFVVRAYDGEGMLDRWENYGSLDAIVDTHDPFTLNDFIQLWKYLNQ